MTVINKITQLTEVDIKKLKIIAKLDKKETGHDIAIWIIARSPWWKSKGYDVIIKELENSQ
jgi:hypothetical protein